MGTSAGSGGTTDGAFPQSGLIQDKNGNFYGTTYLGGAAHSGTVFKVDTSGSETLLYSFAGGADGAFPIAGLVQGPQGNFYGTTYGGGAANYGTVFKLSGTGNETLLHSFNSTDGSYPHAGLVRDLAGNLYGTTQGAVPLGTGRYSRSLPSPSHLEVIRPTTRGPVDPTSLCRCAPLEAFERGQLERVVRCQVIPPAREYSKGAPPLGG